MKKKSKLILSRKGKIYNDKRYICEVIRQIYDIVFINLKDNPEVLSELIELLEEAMVMGNRMVNKLAEYKICQSEMMLKKVSDPKKIRELREERIRLEKIILEGGKVIKKAKEEGIE